MTGRPAAVMRSRWGGKMAHTIARSWQAAIGSAPDWIVITSFNEWPEGTYIEASQAYGTKYLELTAQWSSAFRGSAPPPVQAVSASPEPAPAKPAGAAAAPRPPALKITPPAPTPTPVPTPSRPPVTPEPVYTALGVPARL